LLIIKDRKTGNEIALIPELCKLTGLTKSMRADFPLMKDLAEKMRLDADANMMASKKLFEAFKNSPLC
jgi:hypothetical protein